MTDIVWEEPPAHVLKPVRKGGYQAFAQTLRQNKDRWAVMPTLDGAERSPKGAVNTAQNVRRGVMPAFPKGEYEVAVDGAKVYVRYTGPVEAQGRGSEPAPRDDTEERQDPAEVRAWARRNGYEVPDRGRLSRVVLDAYETAMRQQELDATPTDQED